MTAERGLAGAFNSSIVRRARQDINRLLREGKTVRILTVGKKGREQLRRDHGDKFVGHHDLSQARRLGFEHAQTIAEDVLRRFEEGEFDVATLYFARFQTVLTQVPTALQLIPAVFEEGEGAQGTTGRVNYEYEPDEEEILAELLPRNIATQVFRGLLENGASEQGSRMTAMDSATRNAGEMIDKLTIEYNRTRQATITKELIEIISGAEAL
jgi:F-type H+-transporting ATPase subunit gamma